MKKMRHFRYAIKRQLPIDLPYVWFAGYLLPYFMITMMLIGLVSSAQIGAVPYTQFWVALSFSLVWLIIVVRITIETSK